MSKLPLSIACGDYDRVRPLVDGAVRIDGVDPKFLLLSPEEMFFRAFRHAEFDVSELSLSTHCARVALGDSPYVGVPVFLSRMFRHGAVYIRTDRGVDEPQDLRHRRIGIPEWQLTALVWARGLLAEEYGVALSDVRWVQAGIEQPGRIEKTRAQLPPGVTIEPAPPGATLSRMLETGEIDAVMAPRAPSCYERRVPNVGLLFRDTVAAASDYYRRTGIFPIMHLLGIRKELVKQHAWLPATLLKAYAQAKDHTIRRLSDVAASSVTLPFVEERLQSAQALMGEDFWSYGLMPNRDVLTTFLRYHHQQGLSGKLLTPEELFDAAALEEHRV